MYDMAHYNHYGFGDYAISGITWPFTNNLYNAVLKDYNRNCLNWLRGHIQNNSHDFECELDWRDDKENAQCIINIKALTGQDVDYKYCQLTETERCKLYYEEENKYKKASGGNWTGD
jgi:hypothetical protein